MRLVIVAGGTGGHIYPGLAVAEEIKKRDAAAQLVFIGSREGLEGEIITREGFAIKYIHARAVLRKLSYKAFTAPFFLLRGIFDALFILKRFSPHAILSLGGYVSLPVIVAGKLLGIPLVLHEQNVLPGATNRLAGRFARKVFLSFHESFVYLKGEVVGNPVRSIFQPQDKFAARQKLNLPLDKKVVLVVGGSQGARKINEVVTAALPHLPGDVFVLHITGKRDYAKIVENFPTGTFPYYLPISYLDQQMPAALAAADLVVSRAGATAMAEFMVMGCPMVLIPFPYAAENHQQLNALAAVKQGAAFLVPEDTFTAQKFIELITHSGFDYVKMGKNSLQMAKPAAAQRIVSYIYDH